MSAGRAGDGVGAASEPPALQETRTSQNLNVVSAASGDEVNCVQVTYRRCSPVGITELLVERAKKEPPGTKLGLLQIWKTIMAGLGAKLQPLEPLWVKADLDPQAVVTTEDLTRAEAAAEEALAPCRICVVDLQTFLRQVVRRVALAAKPNGDLLLAVELSHNDSYAFVVTKLTAWMYRSKEGTKFAAPLILQENLRRLGLGIDADPQELYLELTRRAEYYNTVVDAYLRPILLQAVEKLRASPHLAKCGRDRNVIYIAAELFKTSAWFFNAYVGFGRNQLYEALRRHGLLSAPTTVPVDLYDEYGNRVKKRALAFYVSRLSEFIEHDVESICHASAGRETEGEEDASGGYV
jgi:hypothetical protein